MPLLSHADIGAMQSGAGKVNDSAQLGPLWLLPALRAGRGADGRFIITQKFLDGVLEYVNCWPGQVIVCMLPAHTAGVNLDQVEVDPAALPFRLIWHPHDERKLMQLMRGAGTVLASLVDDCLPLASICRSAGLPIVYISEYSLQTRLQIVHTETRNRLMRLRRDLWNHRFERRCREAVSIASGVQCNGTPTYEQYRPLNNHALLYFDTRVREAQIVEPHVLASRAEELMRGGPLRLAFSGRFASMKGADHLPLVAHELRRLGLNFTLDLCGGGPLDALMRQRVKDMQLESHVRFRGVLDFQRELLPFIARDVDLFVCCHRQGDPSCTYLETMSCGTPIAGYANEAFAGLVQTSGIGWTAPLDQPRLLAERIAALDADRAQLRAAAVASRRFAAAHTFEHTMQARVDHLLQCAGAKTIEVAA